MGESSQPAARALETGFRREAGYLDLNSSVNFEAFGQELTVSL